ncbi:MAG TPA: zf-HC2 domain-containing protein [Syntrophorhabdaceae bacterium]|nr:zf-HC2 domain-containing protein [Syntrophorhabdaceae bacterium]
MNRQDHITKIDALLYVYGKLPQHEATRIKMHLDSCRECLAYVIYLEHKKIEACKRMEGLFNKAYKDKLKKEDALFWDAHIKYCDRCLDNYLDFIHRKEEGLKKIFMGYIKGFVTKANQDFLLAEPVVAGSSEKIPFNERQFPIKSFSKRGMDIFFLVDKKGSLKAYLKSNKFITSGSTVSIACRTKRGYDIFASATTGKRGVANLGSIKRLPPPGAKAGYAVIVSGVRDKETNDRA